MLNTEEELNAVFKAHLAGKKIECKYKDPGSDWGPKIQPEWSTVEYSYRVKRTPLVVYVNTYPDGSLTTHRTLIEAREQANFFDTDRIGVRLEEF